MDCNPCGRLHIIAIWDTATVEGRLMLFRRVTVLSCICVLCGLGLGLMSGCAPRSPAGSRAMGRAASRLLQRARRALSRQNARRGRWLPSHGAIPGRPKPRQGERDSNGASSAPGSDFYPDAMDLWLEYRDRRNASGSTAGREPRVVECTHWLPCETARPCQHAVPCTHWVDCQHYLDMPWGRVHMHSYDTLHRADAAHRRDHVVW